IRNTIFILSLTSVSDGNRDSGLYFYYNSYQLKREKEGNGVFGMKFYIERSGGGIYGSVFFRGF
ncbi:hypothetical protein, partial [Listeria seeligeri]|uniref:hypothetical protein n=1 Tax=Listeria seeligeri TaxID=1640 RepID=UPI001F18BB4E